MQDRITWLFVFLVVLVGAGATLGASLVVGAVDAHERFNTVGAAATAASDLETNFVSQAASIRNYFLTGDATAYQSYRVDRQRADVLATRLRSLLLTTPYVDELDGATRAASAWQNDHLAPLIRLAREGNQQELINRYADGTAAAAFAATADRLQALVRSTRAAGAAAERRENSAQRALAVGAAAAVAAAALMVLAVRWLGRVWIARPLEQLRRYLRSARPTPGAGALTGPPELRGVAADVVTLRERLAAEIDQTVRTRQGLGQAAAVLLSVRTQLETAPERLPEGWQVAANLVPADGIVAGDCYDIDMTPSGQLGIVVVDVAGHGAESAVVALRAKELLRAGIRSVDDPAQAVAWASEQMSGLAPDMFVTAFVAQVNLRSGLVSFVNAGHPAPLLCDGLNAVSLGVNGPIIGPFPAEWTTHTGLLQPGQMLACYTDGLSEGRSPSGEEFGSGRIRRLLQDRYGDSAETLVKQVLTEFDAYVSGRAHDDVTLAIVARDMPR